ncbi:MAG: TetR/AcrR family transcriptional regulator [Anaerolineae bacterium]
MSKTRRERLREKTGAEIKQVARQQMATVGAAALSLRGIAREMGMSAPALYRYFDSRDALVTELIIEAYIDLAVAMETAVHPLSTTDHGARFRAVTAAYREWAITHPQDYTLIYGTPIPGYEAPRERTVAPAARVNIAIGTVLAPALQDDRLTMPAAYTNLPAGLQQSLEDLAAYLEEQAVSPAIILLTIYVWSRLHGLIWGELHEHFAPHIADSGELFQVEIEAICQQLSLD